MGKVSNKSIILLLRQVVKCVDKLLMDHGSRTAYVLYKMLQCDGKYEMYEMADYSIFATFHDIGAYKTEELDDMLQFETKSFMPHSVYGYLMMRDFSPFKEEAKILLYHHVNCANYEKLDYDLKHIASYIFLADRLDIYYDTLGSTFDIHSLRQYEGVRYTKEALDLLEGAAKKKAILDVISDKSYQQELDELLEYIVFTNEDEKKYQEMIIHSLGFKDERYAVEAAMCMCICEELAIRLYLPEEQRESLRYAAMIHDVGMLLLPQELVNAQRKLTKDEMKAIETHVEAVETMLREILPVDIVDVALAHHETGNGTGYPKKLKNSDMNTMQRILQIADVVTALNSKRPYRDAKDKQTVEMILQDGVKTNHYGAEVVNVMLRGYDEIIKKANKRREQIRNTRKLLDTEYNKLKGQYLNCV